MMFELLRRSTAAYRRFGRVDDLAPFWRDWAMRLETRVMEDAAFPDFLARLREGHAREDESDDVTGLMQTGGRRLSAADRAVRPRRPNEWMEARTIIDRLPRTVAERVRTILRNFLTGRVNRVGFIYVEMGMMLRDVLYDTSVDTLSRSQEDTAQNAAMQIQRVVESYVDRNFRMELRVMQHFLLQESLRMALAVDEMNTTRLPEHGLQDGQDELEAVHLMFRVNNAVRANLPDTREERSRRVGLTMRALANQIGSEARHLRRLCISLQGLQMLGEDHCRARERCNDDEWLAPLLDELHMLAGAETTGIAVEQEWTREILALRRWLAEDHLDPRRPEVDPDARSSDEPSPTANQQEEDGEESALMQGGRRRPWWQKPRSRTRSPSKPTRRERSDRAREVERNNEHRPWRNEETQCTTSFMSARPSASSTPRAKPKPASRHPATVTTPEGDRNLGIHAWHILTDMVSAHDDPPEDLNYGFRPEQRMNVEATLEHMSSSDRVHMLLSFCRMMALMLNEVAAIGEQVVGAGETAELEGENETEETGLMERFLIKSHEDRQTTKPDDSGVGGLHEVFQTPYEMHLRTRQPLNLARAGPWRQGLGRFWNVSKCAMAMTP